MNILIIEDDAKVQNFLKESLGPDATNLNALSEFPREADFAVLQPNPEVIILDRLIGHFDTKEGIGLLKRKFPEASIMVLSAINNPSERTELLDLGADDYMGKPFSVVELKARIRVMLRRSSKLRPQGNYLRLGATILDLHQRTLSVGESRVTLSAKEFELFHIFAKSIGRVYSKFELMDKVWQANLEIESNVLEVTVMNLRKKLSELKSSVQISSKRNIGYWIET